MQRLSFSLPGVRDSSILSGSSNSSRFQLEKATILLSIRIVRAMGCNAARIGGDNAGSEPTYQLSEPEANTCWARMQLHVRLHGTWEQQLDEARRFAV